MHMADASSPPPSGPGCGPSPGPPWRTGARKLTAGWTIARFPLMGSWGRSSSLPRWSTSPSPGPGRRAPGRGLILAALLGPPAAFLVMASVLTVQALFFADGGLLALGCNIVNLVSSGLPRLPAHLPATRREEPTSSGLSLAPSSRRRRPAAGAFGVVARRSLPASPTSRSKPSSS